MSAVTPASNRQVEPLSGHAQMLGTPSFLSRPRLSQAGCGRLLRAAAEIRAESAQDADEVGYMARVLLQATLPHSAPAGNEFVRTNGNLHVSIVAPSAIGLPYGSYPRLLLAWLTTEAVRTDKPLLFLGESLSAFMKKLGLIPSGGRWGTIARLRDQAHRLFSAQVMACETQLVSSGEHTYGRNITVATEWDLWWTAAEPTGQAGLFQSWVKLSDHFFRQVIDRPVPIDLRAIKALKRSPLALDLYAWLTYRMSYLRARKEIPWDGLRAQFGADYADTAEGHRNFRKKFAVALRKVLAVYDGLRVDEGSRGPILLPSPTHIPKSWPR